MFDRCSVSVGLCAWVFLALNERRTTMTAKAQTVYKTEFTVFCCCCWCSCDCFFLLLPLLLFASFGSFAACVLAELVLMNDYNIATQSHRSTQLIRLHRSKWTRFLFVRFFSFIRIQVLRYFSFFSFLKKEALLHFKINDNCLRDFIWLWRNNIEIKFTQLCFQSVQILWMKCWFFKAKLKYHLSSLNQEQILKIDEKKLNEICEQFTPDDSSDSRERKKNRVFSKKRTIID